MQPAELLNAITNDLKTALGEKLPQLCQLERTTHPYQKPEQVKKALEAFQPQEGWICFQDSITHFKNSELPDEGVILYGEVKSQKNNQALHIHQNGTGGWLLTTYQEQPGETHLVETTQLLGEFDKPGNLHYRVYWQTQTDGEQGYRPICAAFDGFIDKKETKK
jgi:hypothetical protein